MSNDTVVKFDYRGLDDASKTKLYLENINALEVEARVAYLERVITFNKDSLEQNPEPFRFLNKENCSVIVFILPYEFNYSDACQIFFLSTPNKREAKIHVMTHEDLSDLDQHLTATNFFHEKILPLFQYHESQIIFSVVNYYDHLDNNFNIFSNVFDTNEYVHKSSFKDQILRVIKNEIRMYQTINETPLGYFAKNVYKFPFSILDLKPLVGLVQDEDFTYQLDQAMAAYHENLFLPCAATLGVVLETLCIKVLEKHGAKKPKSGDTQLGKLIEKLSSERIITRKDNARLDVAYKMRNLAAHSNPGSTLKEDCHFMLNVINTISFEYLNVD